MPPEEIFIKIYGQNRQDEAIDFLEDESGFVILAQTNSDEFLTRSEEVRAKASEIEGLAIPDNFQPEHGQNEIDYLLIFVDKGGNEIKTVSFNQLRTDTIVNNVIADSRDIPSVIRKTSDGCYLIVGTSTYTIKEQREDEINVSRTVRQSDVFVVKVNANGDKVFEKLYGDTFYSLPDEEVLSLLANEEGADVVEHSDGYVILGTTNRVDREKESIQPGIPFNPEEDPSDFYVVKVSKDGRDIIWQRTTGFPEGERGISILPVGNNLSVVMGTTTKASQQPPGAGGVNVIFARLDRLGAIEGAGYFGLSGDEEPTRMNRVSENSFYIVGTYKSSGKKNKAFLMEVTGNSGQRFHATSIGPREGMAGEEDVEGRDAVQIPGIGYWVVGQVAQFRDDAGSKGSEMLLMRTGTSGVTDPSFGNATIGGLNYGGQQDDELVRIRRLQSGHLVLLGTLGFGGGGSTVVCLMKTNAQGKLEKL